MKVFLRRHLKIFSKVRRRLSSAKWVLLLITTTLFFLSMYLSSCGCDQSGQCDFTFTLPPPGSSMQSPPGGSLTGPSTNPPTDPSALVGNVPTVAPIQQPLTQVQVPTVPALITQWGGASPTAAAGGSSSSKKGNGSSKKGNGSSKKGNSSSKNANAAKDPDNDGDAKNDNDGDGDGS